MPPASVTRSYRLLNRTGALVSYSIASKLDDTVPCCPEDEACSKILAA
jgi:NADPH2:quinone reductase